MGIRLWHEIFSPVLKLLALTFVGCILISAQPAHHRNGKIAFTSDRDGNREIYVMDSDGGNQFRLTNNPTLDDHPAWSPDGKKLAFICENSGGGYSICVMQPDGTHVAEVTPIDGYRRDDFTSSLSWSPDGTRIVFQEATPVEWKGRLTIVDVGSGVRSSLTSGTEGDFAPSWSPDGSGILFSRYGYSAPYWGTIMHTISPDGTGLRQLPNAFTTEGWNDDSPRWSPTGDKIVFVVNVWDFYETIYTANADGTNRRYFDGCLFPGPCDDAHLDRFNPSWSPDGTRIIFHVTDRFWTDIQIYDKKINGTGLRQLTHGPGKNFNASWQPLASDVTVGGRVKTANGTGIRNAVVYLEDAQGHRRSTLTSSFGYYRFDTVTPDEQCTISVLSRRYRFDPLVVQVNEDLTSADLIGIELSESNEGGK